MQRTGLFISCLLLCLSIMFAGCSRKESVPPAVPAASSAPAAGQAAPSGEALFKQFCWACHPDGGNVSDPERTLRSSALKRNRITTPDDIVRIMRNPLSRMIRFDRDTLSDREAQAIAEYILTTFK